MLFDDALEPLSGSNHQLEASVLGLRAAALLWQGRWSEAAASARDAARVGEQVRSLFTCAMGRAAFAYATWMDSGGADTGALQAGADATAWLQTRGGRLFHSLLHGWLADALATSGREREARDSVARALRCARGEDWLGLAMASRALARRAADRGDAARAAQWMRRARAAAARRQSAHEAACNHWAEADIAKACGALADAARERGAALRAFERLNMPWHAALAAARQ
jgi:hypothetical protein